MKIKFIKAALMVTLLSFIITSCLFGRHGRRDRREERREHREIRRH